ncbi:MAG TPA: aminotransferase class I/II-fold pyridoxal phosphate-dependent enzyme, partial [Steroidobacteraceae bacterium]|nr:aminotransferase class I/II-fold pyridoxal phosphate-dependent enzyme [Steroidobacteraceae bacterium]
VRTGMKDKVHDVQTWLGDLGPHLLVLLKIILIVLAAFVVERIIVSLLRSVLPPYAIAQPCIEAAQQALAPAQQRLARERVAAIVRERARLSAALAGLAGVTHVWPSDANFLLVEFDEPARALSRLREARLLVRDFRDRPGLERALRITVGSPEQNDRLVRSLAC